MSVARDADRAVIADVLGRLADKSLVAYQRRESRWRMLDTVRAFAADRLTAGPEHAEVQARYLHWARDTAVALESRLGGDARGPWREEFDAVAGDLRAALAGTGPSAVAHRLARALGHLTFARRFLKESLEHYREAARLAPAPGEGAADLRSAAGCAHLIDSGLAVGGLLLAAAERSRTAGDGDAQAIAIARAVETTARFPPGLTADHGPEEIRRLLDEAAAAGDPSRPPVAAGLAIAQVWYDRIRDEPLDPALARNASQVKHTRPDGCAPPTWLEPPRAGRNRRTTACGRRSAPSSAGPAARLRGSVPHAEQTPSDSSHPCGNPNHRHGLSVRRCGALTGRVSGRLARWGPRAKGASCEDDYDDAHLAAAWAERLRRTGGVDVRYHDDEDLARYRRAGREASKLLQRPMHTAARRGIPHVALTDWGDNPLETRLDDVSTRIAIDKAFRAHPKR
jgi:hypothetical protein